MVAPVCLSSEARDALKRADSQSPLPFYNQQNKGILPQWQCWLAQTKVVMDQIRNLYHNLLRLGPHPYPKQVHKIKKAPK